MILISLTKYRDNETFQIEILAENHFFGDGSMTFDLFGLILVTLDLYSLAFDDYYLTNKCLVYIIPAFLMFIGHFKLKLLLKNHVLAKDRRPLTHLADRW